MATTRTFKNKNQNQDLHGGKTILFFQTNDCTFQMNPAQWDLCDESEINYPCLGTVSFTEKGIEIFEKSFGIA